ncbi:MAG TPA: energy transducer TonB [Gemmatimonadales bacterium]|nr:energy transducer TonB [Gemmatimonadales bacterium]MCB9517586.1 energy transducer TonB [Gemmatimonadales bacterium]HPF61437.1 energy transducer TonB [Gemmatimonadales bacterium]HRX17689.1 energy transducer TonB [Gemmatimonadales bacterium]
MKPDAHRGSGSPARATAAPHLFLLVAAVLAAPSMVAAQAPAARDTSCGARVADSATTEAVRPRRTSGPAPVYPAALRRAGTGGVVRVQYVVDCAGRVDSASVRVVASPDERFSDAAVFAIRHTRFRPATREGRPVVYRMEQNIRFAVR